MQKRISPTIWFILLAILLFAGCDQEENNTGNLYIIGGGSRLAAMIDHMVDLAGGDEARILIIPNASSDPVGTARYQQNQFIEAGAGMVDYCNLTRETVDKDDNLKLLEGVTGIFFSGGDQRRLQKILLDSQFLAQMHELYQEEGILVAGTSAGAAVMSPLMITGDELVSKDTLRVFSSIIAGNIETWPGFNFLPNSIVDQHFIKRKRHNRLLSLVLENPGNLGIGIDESTAIWVKPDNSFDVVGESQVVVIDGPSVTDTGDPGKILNGSNLGLHILTAGQSFDLNKRQVIN